MLEEEQHRECKGAVTLAEWITPLLNFDLINDETGECPANLKRMGETCPSGSIDCLYPFSYNCVVKEYKQQRKRDAAWLAVSGQAGTQGKSV